MGPDLAQQNLFGESNPILDVVFSLAAIAFEEIGYLEFYFKINHHCQLYIIGAGKRGISGEGYDTTHFYFSYILSGLHNTHTVHTFYILDFSSFLRLPLKVVCCCLISLPLFSGKARRGVDSVAPLAWSGSSWLSLQQSHLSQGRAVDTQLPLPTLNFCHVGGSGKGFLSEGEYHEQLLSHHLIAFD